MSNNFSSPFITGSDATGSTPNNKTPTLYERLGSKRDQLPKPFRETEHKTVLGSIAAAAKAHNFKPFRAHEMEAAFGDTVTMTKYPKNKSARKKLWSAERSGNVKRTEKENRKTLLAPPNRISFRKSIVGEKPKMDTRRITLAPKSIPVPSVQKTFLKPKPPVALEQKTMDHLELHIKTRLDKIEHRLDQLEQNMTVRFDRIENIILESHFRKSPIPQISITEPTLAKNDIEHELLDPIESSNESNPLKSLETTTTQNLEKSNLSQSLDTVSHLPECSSVSEENIPPTCFEELEMRLENCSIVSLPFSDSDQESPLELAKIMNCTVNNEEASKVNAAIVFGNKMDENSTDYHVFQYNEMRTNLPLLCTPKTTGNALSLMTPSVKNSDKKFLSRRIQTQLFNLNKNHS